MPSARRSLAALAAPPPAHRRALPRQHPRVAPDARDAAAGLRRRLPSPLERLTTAIKAAPTVGFIWGDGLTGYSIKYAWRSASPSTAERVVLVTDRRLGAQRDVVAPRRSLREGGRTEFTVVEMRIDGKGVGEGKSSLTRRVVVDAAANTLAIDEYTAAPVLLKVTR